jgi:imidazoleglycerol phosphate dehydratase HisB
MKTNQIKLTFGDVRVKRVETLNDFISHMIEHIAWRMGCAIDLYWQDDDWMLLGEEIGIRIRSFSAATTMATALGMLDEGSAEVLITNESVGNLNITTGIHIDREWFLSQRCEQLSSGRALVDLLTGLAKGLCMKIAVRVCNFDDPHHTWEGVFRAVGVALAKIYTPTLEWDKFLFAEEKKIQCGDITIISRSGQRAEIIRHTAESQLSVDIDFSKKLPVVFEYKGAPIAHFHGTDALEGFSKLLQLFADNTGISLKTVFRSKVLSSSHVLLEDTGMVIGKALREILVKRMMAQGINGAGSSLQRPDDFDLQKITVGVSVEGRKFFRIVPTGISFESIQRHLIIGETVMGGLFSEDLDDFLDGLSWGLGCSIVVHIKDLPSAQAAWLMIFENLGRALREVFAINPYRKGVPPGVKANLS